MNETKLTIDVIQLIERLNKVEKSNEKLIKTIEELLKKYQYVRSELFNTRRAYNEIMEKLVENSKNSK